MTYVRCSKFALYCSSSLSIFNWYLFSNCETILFIRNFVVAIIIAVFALLFSIPVSCDFYFRYNNEIYQELSLRYGFIKIGIPEKRQDPEDTKDNSKNPEKSKKTEKKAGSTKEIISFGRDNLKAVKETIYAVLGYMFKKAVKINKLKIKLVFGVDDAMETALIFGAVSAFIYNVIGVMDRNMRLKKHITEIRPAFNNPHIFAECGIKISTSIGRVVVLAIIALWHAVPLLIRYRKLNKGSDTREEN